MNREYLRHFTEEVFAYCHLNLKFPEFNFTNLLQIRENFFLQKYLLQKFLYTHTHTELGTRNSTKN